MKVLLIGSGGREHALFWKLSQSKNLTKLNVFPGNGGFPEDALVSIHDSNGQSASLSNLSAIVEHVSSEKYDLVVVGPEQPLVDGIVDALQAYCPVFGPSRGAARLEGSKEFSKSFMSRHGIPTAEARSFHDVREALEYLSTRTIPVVIKADGLAAGKGVTVAQTLEEAQKAIRESLEEGKFGDSGKKVLIEDFLKGEEASVFALCDGQKAIPFVAAQDFKRAFDGDQGPNTGGMGAYTPVSMMTPDLMKQVQSEVLDRTMDGMQKEGTPYRGLLYAGLMIDDGKPSVVEFNVRFGDPETQPLMMRLDEDLLDLMYRSATGDLENRELKFYNGASIIVVLAAEGYPGTYKKNIPLRLPDLNDDRTMIFHAGTRLENGRLYSTGGRILGVTARAENLSGARERAYQIIDSIQAESVFYRKDIALKAV